MRNDPILIIGAGVIGLSLAWELARRSGPLLLLDSGPASHPPASWAGAGILPPGPKKGAVDPLDQLKSLSSRLHETWAQQLQHDTGIDTGFRKSGGIYLAGSTAEAATLKANQYWWDLHGISYEKLDREQLLQQEPHLEYFAGSRFRDAWFVPEEFQIRNPWLLQALRKVLSNLGVTQLQETVREIGLSNSGFPLVTTEKGSIIEGSKLCLCSGAWSRILLERMGFTTGIMPVRGQMVLYHLSRPLTSRIINEGNRYLVPRDDGYLLAGSVEEEVGFDCRTTDDAILSIRNWAESIFPTLAESHIVKAWAGLRPGSFDGYPYIGAIPGAENLYVACGHFRSGLQLASATAVVTANEMLGHPNEIDLNPFRIGRG